MITNLLNLLLLLISNAIINDSNDCLLLFIVIYTLAIEWTVNQWNQMSNINIKITYNYGSFHWLRYNEYKDMQL